MILPQTGSVVVIDDHPNEALPVITALSKKGIAATYYRGFRKTELPDAPSQIIRMVILDLQLFAGVTDPHIIATNAIQVLKSIIPESNGPYILLLWSRKEALYKEDVINAIKNPQNNIVPAFIVSLPKTACLRQVMSTRENDIAEIIKNLSAEFDEDELALVRNAIDNHLSPLPTVYEATDNAIETIQETIRTEMDKTGVFHLMIIWENIARGAAAGMINEISVLNPPDKYWEVNMRNIFKRMTIARVGQNEVPMKVQIQEAINTLNNSYIDGVENAIKLHDFSEAITLDTDVIIGEHLQGVDYMIRKGADASEFVRDNVAIGKGVSPKALEANVRTNVQIAEDDKTACAGLFLRYGSIPFSLNTRLHIEEHPSNELVPGNIYINNSMSPDQKAVFLSTFFKAPVPSAADCTIIDLEVSPVCDYAQNKWKRSRIIHGVIFPSTAKPRDEDNFYTVRPTFVLDGKICRIVFDFHHFGSIDLAAARAKPVKYRLKRELLLDIIATLSSHVNRPGISLIE